MKIKNIKELKNKKVHFVGIGGISMSALAQILHKNKIYVQGSDLAENDEIKKLKKKNIKVFNTHSASNVEDCDVVVYSSAIKEDNEELVFAKENNLIIFKRAELLALVAENYKTIISVAGSHGKTTTAGMISEIFLQAKKNPTIHLGGELNKIKSNYNIGGKKYFITESCEYKDNFLFLHPDLSVILNIDNDHLDYFGSLENEKQSFVKFSQNLRLGGLNIVNIDDGSARLFFEKNTVFFGTKKCELRAKNIVEYSTGYFSFDVIFDGYNLGNIKLNILGRHNVYNVLASIFVSLLCDINFEDIKIAIENYHGTKRRTQFICKINGAFVYHDYAHHPKQIKAMLDAGKSMAKAKNSKLIIVFEPHTFSRTKYLIDDFKTAFCKADKLVLLPVYSARENESDGYSSKNLFENVSAKEKYLAKDFDEAKNMLKILANEDDIVFILGAGTIEKLAELLKI